MCVPVCVSYMCVFMYLLCIALRSLWKNDTGDITAKAYIRCVSGAAAVKLEVKYTVPRLWWWGCSFNLWLYGMGCPVRRKKCYDNVSIFCESVRHVVSLYTSYRYFCHRTYMSVPRAVCIYFHNECSMIILTAFGTLNVRFLGLSHRFQHFKI